MEDCMGKSRQGMTLVEVIVGLAAFGILVIGAAAIIITAFRSQRVVWDQLGAQADGRKILEEVVNDARRADLSSIGAYPIVTATTNTLTFYANVDADGLRERVRYWLTGRVFKKGVIKPTGNPLQYVTTTEQVVDVATNIVNQSQGNPVFLYYDAAYTGTSTPLTQPVSTTLIRLIRVKLDIEKDPNFSPVPLHVESVVGVRSLKTN